MKILILSDVESIHTKRWVKALSEKGITITLFSLSPNSSSFYDELDRVKIICASHNTDGSVFSKIRYLAAIPELKKLIKNECPDIIHSHYASSYGLLGALAKTDIPYIVSVWGSDVYDFPKTYWGKLIIKYNLRKADHVLSTSHIMAKETRKYTDKKIVVTPFGVDTELFKPLYSSPTESFVIGNVKTLRPKYGIDVLIRATEMVIKNNPSKSIRLEIYGEGPQKKDLIRLATDLRINDRVEFKGYVQNDRLPEVYNSLSVSVSVSNSESFGVVAVEAMACGCPVVVSDADGFTEVVANGVTGFIVPKHNPKAVAEAIQRFIDMPSLRNDMGAAGRQRVLNLYNWNDNVDLMVREYNKLAMRVK